MEFYPVDFYLKLIMKATCIFLLVILHCQISFAQDKVNREAFRDSILNKYLKDGAYSVPIYSKGYGIYIDSALIYLPSDAYLWQQRAMPCFKQMKYEIGMRYIDSAVKYNPARWLDYRAFIKCIFQKNYKDAIADFQKAILLNGSAGIMDHPYDFYIGLCYLQLNKYDLAFSKFNLCIANREKNKGNAAHYMDYFYRGIVLYEVGHYKAAIANFDKSLKQYPTFSDAEFYKALCLANTNQMLAGLQLITKSKSDFEAGYTINEDNAIYERYPYQITSTLLQSYSVMFNLHTPN